MTKEITVILKDAERTYKQRFLIYKDFCLHPDDSVIKVCIQSARKNFEGDPEDIQVRTLMVIR